MSGGSQAPFDSDPSDPAKDEGTTRTSGRLTNAFSKKVENHAYAVALHFRYYRFVKLHGKLRMSLAMTAGVSDRLWKIGNVVALVEAADEPAKKRGSYKKVSGAV